jgi:DNA-binding NtrC family response regulator
MVLAEGEELQPSDLPEEIKPARASQSQIAQANETSESNEVTGGVSVPFTADFREDRREFERRYITRCLEESGGNVTRAASLLGMHRQSLQHKLRELGLARRYVSVPADETEGSADE